VIAIAKTPSLKASALSVSKRLSTSWPISAHAHVFLGLPSRPFGQASSGAVNQPPGDG
jgi:hypothetical protein